jgi:hypothetical protein
MMWYERIERFYNSGLWTREMVEDAVTYRKITEEECRRILGEEVEEETEEE